MSSDINQVIEKDISEHKIFLYMKGDKAEPRCGFSAQVVQVLNKHKADYHTKDVLEDWDLREGIKAFSNWPTIPQLYVDGKFVGGCDIVMELDRNDKLSTILNG